MDLSPGRHRPDQAEHGQAVAFGGMIAPGQPLPFVPTARPAFPVPGGIFEHGALGPEFIDGCAGEAMPAQGLLEHLTEGETVS